MNEQARRWYSVRETADKVLNCHIQTVYDLIARGEVPACRVGRLVRVDMKALNEKMEQQAKGRRP